MGVHISIKIEFKSKTLTRDKERQYTMIMGSIHQEDIVIINIYISQYQGTQIYKTNINRTKGINRQ